MLTRTKVAALCALTFGLAACDSSQEPGAISEAETADGIFEANAFPTGVNIISVSNRPDTENRDRIYKHGRSLERRSKLVGEPRIDRAVPGGVKSFQQVAFAGPQRDFVGTFDGNDDIGKLIRTNRRGTIEAITNVGRRPKGVIVDAEFGGSSYVGVADFGITSGSMSPSQVFFYNQNFAPGEAPVATLTNFGTGGQVWDLFYSQEADILFLSKTNGEVAAYDNFSAMITPVLGGAAAGSSVTPTREFAISNPQNSTQVKRSRNLHGITYDAETDILIVSDVSKPDRPVVWPHLYGGERQHGWRPAERIRYAVQPGRLQSAYPEPRCSEQQQHARRQPGGHPRIWGEPLRRRQGHEPDPPLRQHPERDGPPGKPRAGCAARGPRGRIGLAVPALAERSAYMGRPSRTRSGAALFVSAVLSVAADEDAIGSERL